MASNFNLFEEPQFSIVGEPKRQITNRERLMMEALLEDSGFFVASPTSTAAPAPTPTPAAAPAPTPAASTSAPATVNAVVRLAMTTVKPGDLITADFANNLVEALLALDRRLTAIESTGKPMPAPTPSTPTPSPTPVPTRSAPVIDKVEAFTIVGRGVSVTVTGDNIGEGLVERVLLGATSIALSKIKFEKGGFNFLTTTAVIKEAKNRLTVVTSGGEDSAALTASTKDRTPVQ